jgi:PhoPQ-activated pathogenicity-related protein
MHVPSSDMNIPLIYPLLSVAALVFTVLSGPSSAASRTAIGERTALDRYVQAPDPNYSFRLASSVQGDGCTTYMIDMISQAWLTPNEVARPLWQHWLTIVKPDTVTSSTAMLFISGGSHKPTPPSKAEDNMLRVAKETDTIVASLSNVPNQPTLFAGEAKGRTEDSLIAYTWDKFLRTGDEKWPARLPMTKAAVRALDTITAFCASEEGGKLKVDKFFVAGGSKRGWTTWCTAAVDDRVIAIAPIVIDMLNIQPSFHHHWEVYGFYAPAVGDYTRARIMDWDGTPEYQALMKIEEPYQYRDRLTLPKFCINATGDQFFVPDSAQFYWNDLTGVKYLRYVPNADHSLKGSDAWTTLIACYNATVKGSKLPKFDWALQDDGSISVSTADKPDAVKLWQATNPTARDFRVESIGRTWTSTDLEDAGSGVSVFSAKVAKPERGWTAFFAELTYENGTSTPYKFTTQVRVIPEVKPFKYAPLKSPR